MKPVRAKSPVRRQAAEPAPRETRRRVRRPQDAESAGEISAGEISAKEQRRRILAGMKKIAEGESPFYPGFDHKELRRWTPPDLPDDIG